MNRSPASHILSGFATIFLVLALLPVLLGPVGGAGAESSRAGSWRMEKGRT